MPERKHYIDNIRWVTVLLVIVYHVVYMFNSAGVVSNFDVQGIPQVDAILYLLYPWFMNLLFVVAGISARYSLERRGTVTFIKDRVRRILIPSIGGVFLLGWIPGWVTSRYVDIFAGNAQMVSGFVKYLIYCLCGIGPLWFAHELFLATMILMVLRFIDKKDKLWKLGGKVNFMVLILLVFAVWGSSMVLNTPIVEVYRNGIYIFMFLMGYYIFSHEEVTDILVKFKTPLLFVAMTMAVAYIMCYFGKNYTSKECLESFFTNAYAWVMILTVLGGFKAVFNVKNGFTVLMRSCSFGAYVLHYPLMCIIAYSTVNAYNFPMWANYLVIFAVEMLLLPFFFVIVLKIPGIRFLLLGARKNRKKVEETQNSNINSENK